MQNVLWSRASVCLCVCLSIKVVKLPVIYVGGKLPVSYR